MQIKKNARCTEKLTTYQAHTNVKYAYIICFLHPMNTAVETGMIQ